MNGISVYDFDGRLEKRKEQIRNYNRLPKTKKLILRFLDEKEAEVSKARVQKYSFLLPVLMQYMNKEITSFKMTDYRQLVKNINDSKKANGHSRSEWNKADLRTTLKVFIKWLRGNKYNSKDFEWLRTTLPYNVMKSRVQEGQIFDIKEIEKMISVAGNTRDKAMIAVAYESAVRPQELLTLTIGSVTFDHLGAVINIQQSKTMPRPIRLISSATYLRAWVNIHPFRDNVNAPLWIRHKAIAENPEVIEIASFAKVVKLIAKRAGINKRVYPYLFRHTRITHLLRQYPDQIVKRISGHASASKHFEVYNHIVNEDVEKAVLEKNGLLRNDDDVKKELEKPIQCWNCRTFNSAGAKICEQCNFSLDLSSMSSLFENIKEIQKFLPKLMELRKLNPEELLRLKHEREQTLKGN